MFRPTLAIVLASTSAIAAPREAPHEVRGIVVDQLTGDGIDGVIVMADHATVATSEDGRYAIKIDDGEQLVFTAPGYALRIVPGAADLAIALVPSENEQIEITGKAPDPPKAQTYQLSSDDIRILPGSGNDMLRAAQALPGVARLPYSYGGLVLRGSSPRDNEVYLDGIEVPLAFHFGGVTSFYPSGMLTNLSVQNGGFDASYGRAQGGIVTLDTREPRRDQWRTGGSVGLLDSSVFAEGPVGSGGILMGVRRSYFDVVAVAWAPDDLPLPSYLDTQVRMSFGDPTREGRITPLLFFAYDHVTANSAGKNGHEDTSTLSMFFVRAGMPYLRQWGPLSLRVTPWVGVDQLSFESVTNQVAETFDRPKYPGGVRADLTRDYSWGELRGGIDLQGGYLSHFQQGLGQPGDVLQQINGDTSIWWNDTALWTDARINVIKDRLTLKPGLRAEHYGLSSEEVLDPRLAIRERLTDHLVLRETVGRYHQSPTPGDVDPNGGNPTLKSSYFDQSAVGVEGEWDGWSGSLTGYYNLGNDLGVRMIDATGEFKDLGGLGPTFELLLEKQLGLAFYRENGGRARDRGIELMIKRTTENWFGMIAYTLAQAERDDPELVATMANSVDRGFRPFELDQRHNLNLIASRKLGVWRLGARIQLVSGTPYTPLTTATNPNPPRLSENLPMFFQLDLRADRTWQRDWGLINFYADIQNATNYSNVEAREQVTVDGQHPDGINELHGLPIAPFIGVEFVPK
ncbi:MAG TPA: TonB-dependent receptor [Kofleriaceae bacterium]|nr:TonB-dependent receptor [Kofleriaceae bacterium]